jgi:hypothetical protein
MLTKETELRDIWSVTTGLTYSSEWGFRSANYDPKPLIKYFESEYSARAYVVEEVWNTIKHRKESMRDTSEMEMLTKWEQSKMNKLSNTPLEMLKYSICERIHSEGCVEINAVDEEFDPMIWYSPIETTEVCIYYHDMKSITYRIEKLEVCK